MKYFYFYYACSMIVSSRLLVTCGVGIVCLLGLVIRNINYGIRASQSVLVISVEERSISAVRRVIGTPTKARSIASLYPNHDNLSAQTVTVDDNNNVTLPLDTNQTASPDTNSTAPTIVVPNQSNRITSLGTMITQQPYKFLNVPESRTTISTSGRAAAISGLSRLRQQQRNDGDWRMTKNNPVRLTIPPEALTFLSNGIKSFDSTKLPIATRLLNEIFSSWKELAYEEAGIRKRMDGTHQEQPTEMYPIVPIGGYRQCLRYLVPYFTKGASNIVLYMGKNTNRCNEMKSKTGGRNCYPMGNLVVQPNFVGVSDAICRSKVLVCSIGSSYLCGLLGASVQTPVIVDPQEYATWPQHMHDFQFIIVDIEHQRNGAALVQQTIARLYDVSNDNERTVMVRNNHRLLFDRYTIKTTHPARMEALGFPTRYRNETGMNVFLYSDESLCGPDERTAPLQHGNMGDTMGSFLAAKIATELNMSYHIRCNFDGKNRSIPPRDNHLTYSFIGSMAGPATRDINPNVLIQRSIGSYRNIILGMGLIDMKGSRISTKKIPFSEVLGVRGPYTRDLFLLKQGLNPEVVGDPGLYFYDVFRDEIDAARENANQKSLTETAQTTETMRALQIDNKNETTEELLYNTMKELCFISHEVEHDWFQNNLTEYKDVTFRAGKLGSNGIGQGGDIFAAARYLATCKHVVSSSLHGVIFAHALSIPALPIQVTSLLHGGDFKFLDYYHGVHVTSFTGRQIIHNKNKPESQSKWIELIQSFPQPQFPINSTNLRVVDIVKSVYGR